MSEHNLTADHYKSLIKQASAERVFDDAFFLRCNGNVHDRIYVAAIGDAGRGIAGRVCLLAQRVTGETVSLMVTAAEARMFAAELLDAADYLDGVTPLVFFPPGSPDGAEPEPVQQPSLADADPFAVTPCCTQCGAPEDSHPFRHPFQSPFKSKENDQ